METGQNPLFDALGTPPENKRHVVYSDDGHSLHASSRRNQVISEILAWFEKYQPR